MTQPIQLTDSVFAVEVPEDLQGRKPEYHFQPSITDLINERKGDSELIISFELKTCGLPRTKLSVKLPGPGNWQLICTTKEVTEEQAKVIAQVFAVNMPDLYRNHEWPQGPNYFSSAVESVRSLVRSKGLDPDKTLLIKKLP